MIIRVKVKAAASRNKVSKSALPGVDYDVKTTAVREKGKANLAVLKLLAEHLQISTSQLTIKAGQTSNLKTISCDE